MRFYLETCSHCRKCNPQTDKSYNCQHCQFYNEKSESLKIKVEAKYIGNALISVELEPQSIQSVRLKPLFDQNGKLVAIGEFRS